MTKEIEKWWNEASKQYQIENKISAKSAHYGPYAPDENEIRLLGNVKGKKILEIGCGGGQCSIAFAREGARCTGIDISEEQLKFARELAKKNKVNVKFIQGDIQTLKGIKSNSFDIVFSAWALQYVPDLTKCFKEICRVLRKKGLFVFSLNHPFNSIFDDKKLEIKRSYFKTGKDVEEEIWPDGKKHIFVQYNRKLSDIYESLTDANLFAEKIIEPLKVRKDPWEKDFPLRMAKLVPPTIIFKAIKK